MAGYRVVRVNVVTSEVTATGEGYGDVRGGYDDLILGLKPWEKLVRLTEEDIISPSLQQIADGVATPAEKGIIRLPDSSKIEYDSVTDFLVARARPIFDERDGIGTTQTESDIQAAAVASGSNPGLATIYAAALKEEYDNEDPLEGVFVHGTDLESVFVSIKSFNDARSSRRTAVASAIAAA